MREIAMWLLSVLVAVPLLCIGSNAAEAAEAKPNIIRLEPKPMVGVEQGKAVVVKGRAGPAAHRFIIDKLSYMMPVAVALRPVNEGDRVGLTVTKYAWDQPLRSGETDGDILRYVFRTEGEFQLSVEAKNAGTPYRLMVWVGDESKPEFAPVVVKAGEYREENAGTDGGPLVLWVIAIALIAIVVLLGTLILKRKAR